jgi:hypothetical protein
VITKGVKFLDKTTIIRIEALNSIVVGFVAFPLHRGTDGERYDESEKSEH